MAVDCDCGQGMHTQHDNTINALSMNCVFEIVFLDGDGDNTRNSQQGKTSFIEEKNRPGF